MFCSLTSPTPTPQTPPMVSIHFYFWHQHRNQNVYQDYPSILKLFAYNLPSFPCFHLKKGETLDEEGKKALEKNENLHRFLACFCLQLASSSLLVIRAAPFIDERWNSEGRRKLLTFMLVADKQNGYLASSSQNCHLRPFT